VAARTRSSPLKELPPRAQEAAGTEAAAAAAGPVIAVKRSPAKLQRKRPVLRLPPGCPTGPWPTADAALYDINRYTSDHSKAGGGWGSTWLKGLLHGNSARGDQRVFGCADHKKTGCNWHGKLEETTDGWMWYALTEHNGGEGKLAVVGFGHSHPLAVTLGQRLAHAAMREIPEELRSTAQTMRESGAPIKDVENWLKLEVTKRTGKPAAFLYEDVRSLVGHSTSARSWDATNFIEKLAKRKQGDGLAFDIKLDVDGRLENAFWVARGGMEVYAVGCVGLHL